MIPLRCPKLGAKTFLWRSQPLGLSHNVRGHHMSQVLGLFIQFLLNSALTNYPLIVNNDRHQHLFGFVFITNLSFVIIFSSSYVKTIFWCWYVPDSPVSWMQIFESSPSTWSVLSNSCIKCLNHDAVSNTGVIYCCHLSVIRTTTTRWKITPRCLFHVFTSSCLVLLH